MMNKERLKEIARQIRCCNIDSVDDDIRIQAADYLDSLATLADEAPNSLEEFATPLMGYGRSYVTKEYADYYQAKCAVLSGELADAKQKIAQYGVRWEYCEFVGSPPEPHSSWKSWCESRQYQRVKVMSVYHVEDQPKPVMMPLQFEALWTAWEAYSDSIEEHNGELVARKLRAKEYARKELCGEKP